ncbi:MAG: FtsX-like permease family protein [Gemmatimonas sp.]|nr:FtsX-like permease family protein [Gemmatimonas sp.]
MSEERWLRRSERWLRLLLRLYPEDFREEMAEGLLEAYRDRCRAAFRRGGVLSLGGIWLRSLVDSLRNGVGERVRPGITWRRVGNWGRDPELVVRRLRRAPMFVAAMVGTLTVGLGAFAVVYTVVDKVLIEPLPYDEPENLYFVWRDYGPIFDLNRGWLGGTDVVALEDAGVIQEVAGVERDDGVTLTGGTTDGEPQEVAVMTTSPNLFELLGVQPELGRGFTPSEVGPGRPAVAVLTYGLWSQRFGADPSIVGQEIRLDGEPYKVIGVMARDFSFVQHASLELPQSADLYTTFDLNLAETNPGAGSYAGLLRARPGSSPEAVEAAVATVGRMVDERDFESRGLRLYPVAMEADLVSRVRPAIVMLGLAGLLLVVVLMVNLATLLLVRAAQREREFAISRALGADRLALVRATLLEGGVLGALGGVGGALVAVWGTRALVALAPLDLPRRDSIAVDWGVAGTVIGVGALLGLLAGAVPAAWATRTRLATLLAATAVRGGGGHGRMRRAMVVVQVALSLVLLSAGGLVLRSFEQMLRANPGFDPSRVLTLRVPVPQARYPDTAAVRSLHERIHAGLSTLPGVRSVGAAGALPLSADASQTTVGFPGAPGNTGETEHDRPLVDRVRTRPGYFEALGIPVLAGRAFEETPTEGVREALIDRTLAAEFFPTGSPIGATLMFFDDSLRVIGVVEHARLYNVYRDDRPQVYLRTADFLRPTLSWALRTNGSPLSLAAEAQATIWEIDPELAVADIRSMDQVVSDSVRQQRVSAVLISGFSLGALLLAAMGLFGVVSGSVTRRSHEVAVRLALGAAHGRVLRLVVREGMVLVFLGLLIGAPGVLLAARIIGGVLVGISPFDPPTLGAVAIGLALVALAACYIPARRVAGIEPARLLRQD